MNSGTQYLFCKLHLEKLSRLQFGKDWPNKDWSSFEALKKAGENFYSVRVELKLESWEDSEPLKIRKLALFFARYWSVNPNPEY